jgi:hypothetical protein
VPALWAPLICASQPWEKDSANWTPGEVERLLGASPWAQAGEAVLASDPGDQIEETPQHLPGAGEAGLAGGSPKANENGGHWDGGVGRNRRGRLPTVPVLVRWDSALPIREALAKKNEAGGLPANGSEAAQVQDYVITLFGLVQAGHYNESGKTETASHSDNSVDPRNPEEVLEAFMAYSRLGTKGSPAIHAENVKLDAATGAVHIFFPRVRPIEAGDKEVVFTTHLGDLNVQAKFRLAAMKYRGKLEL